MSLLAVLPDCRKATVVAFLAAMPAARQAQIRTASTDMWEGYVTAAAEVLPQATIVIDRFHVALHYREGVDALRRRDLRRLREGLPEAQ